MTNKEVKGKIADLQAVQNITDIYQQVAAMRMRKVRDGITNNRSFYQKLSEIYLETQACYQKKSLSRSTNGKGVAVLFSSNTGLYGAIVKNVFDQFVEDADKSNNDLVITGQLGRNWFQALAPQKPFKYFDINDGTDSLDTQLKQVYAYISKYSSVKVYHGLFKNIVEQQVNVATITQQIEPKNPEAQTLPFLFEPSIERVLQTFEDQLLYSFFNQSAYESALSKYGSRMLSLDSATQNVSKILVETRLMSNKMKHRVQNKKQLESLSSWRIH